MDEKEFGHLDYQHFILRQVMKGNTFAPVDQFVHKHGQILDVGCGTPSMRPLAHSLLHVPHEQFDAVIGRLATEWEMYRTCYEVYFACGQVEIQRRGA